MTCGMYIPWNSTQQLKTDERVSCDKIVKLKVVMLSETRQTDGFIHFWVSITKENNLINTAQMTLKTLKYTLVTRGHRGKRGGNVRER